LQRQLRETKRKLKRRPHVVSVFIELDDPYSYLLSCYLPELAAHYDIEVRVYLSEAIQGALRPAPELYPEYALRDCRRLARELGIPFLDKGSTPPVEHRRDLLEALAIAESRDDFETELYQTLAAYWRGDSESAARRVEGIHAGVGAQQMLERNGRLLESLGHYNSAMIHYEGEWYWGIDRLHYLVERLDALGIARTTSAAKIASIGQVMQIVLPVEPLSVAVGLPPVELYFSFRSPYSYLSLLSVFRIVDAFGLELQIRPVLPMVMRGMAVPLSKMRYIMLDAGREARRRQISFGKFTDPVGSGVERCMAVLQYAVGENRGREFVSAAGEAIWSRGIDVASDNGLRTVVEKAGLAWPAARAAIDDDSWRSHAEHNRQTMMELGSWGVPTLRMDDFVTWGQDRDWLLLRHIEALCDTGDGILV
jgi:2-hydroxychromene-2-carboxylate isomerase